MLSKYKDKTLEQFMYDEYKVENGDVFRMYYLKNAEDDYAKYPEYLEGTFTIKDGTLYREKIDFLFMSWKREYAPVEIGFLENVLGGEYIVDTKALKKQKLENLKFNVDCLAARVTELEERQENSSQEYNWKKALTEGLLISAIMIVVIYTSTWMYSLMIK